MDGFQWMPNRFLSWPYHGAPEDEDQDAHEALERAAQSFLPQPQRPPRRRGRPPRIREAPPESR
jgi:hypothetical protein